MNFRSAALLLAAPVLWAADPSLLQVKTVYLMPMGSGLDQYLAGQLTAESVFQVVTDPALADAVLTDRLGTSFEQSFAQLYPSTIPPPPAEAAKTEAVKPPPASDSIGSMLAGLPDAPARVSSFSRGRGNIFLVDRKTRRVLWSDFRRPKNARPDEVNRTAGRFVDRLKDEMKDLRKPVASR
ncbi:MAG TPA: hypothetical protein VEQ63_14660 [Bryobacteraceae bacterium]|nr:hypothetical protein [Bryobacteraceae bacterium]